MPVEFNPGARKMREEVLRATCALFGSSADSLGPVADMSVSEDDIVEKDKPY